MSGTSKTRGASRKRYSQEYRIEALLLSNRVGVKEAARQLGLHESQLYGWRLKAQAERNQSDTEREQATEIARLKRQLADQAEELAIVKKAAAYFAKSLK
jgi:transposase